MIKVTDLSKKYGSKIAVNNISFSVGQGEIVGFLGPNGAGKTTTLGIITGYISPSKGIVEIDGKDISQNQLELRKKIGYLPENPPLYVDMTVKEYLNFVYELRKAKFPRKQHIEDIAKKVGIKDVMGRIIRNLSKGYKQRVGIAQALIGEPEILILDEPTVGLDPIQVNEIRNLIKQLGKERTIILSSHILSEIQAICKRVIVINEGIIVADDCTEKLAEKIDGGQALVVRVVGDKKAVNKCLSKIDGVTAIDKPIEVEKGSFDYKISFKSGCDIRQNIFRNLADEKYTVLMIENVTLSLEDVFLKLTSKGRDVK